MGFPDPTADRRRVEVLESVRGTYPWALDSAAGVGLLSRVRVTEVAKVEGGGMVGKGGVASLRGLTYCTYHWPYLDFLVAYMPT